MTLTRIGVESAVVVASILLAFAIDAWWDSKNDRDRELMLLAGLAQEFRANRAIQDGVIGWHRTAESAAVQLLEIAGGNPLPGSLNPDSVLAEVFLTGVSYNPSSGALDSYLALGTTAGLVSPDLRSQIASWSGMVADVAEDELRVLESVDRQLAPYLTARGSVVTSLAAAPELRGQYPSVQPLNELAGLASEPEFQNMVARRLAMERWALVEHERLRLKLDSILTGLEDVLGGP
jgi:hypothetical protein